MEDMSEHFPAVIIHYDVLEVLIDKVCSRLEGGIGYGLGEYFPWIPAQGGKEQRNWP